MVVYWLLLGAVVVPVFLVGRSVLFNNWEEFFDAIGYWIKPDILSVLQGEFWEDFWAEFKLGLLLTLTFGIGTLVHFQFGAPIQAWLHGLGLP